MANECLLVRAILAGETGRPRAELRTLAEKAPGSAVGENHGVLRTNEVIRLRACG